MSDTPRTDALILQGLDGSMQSAPDDAFNEIDAIGPDMDLMAHLLFLSRDLERELAAAKTEAEKLAIDLNGVRPYVEAAFRDGAGDTGENGLDPDEVWSVSDTKRDLDRRSK
jgi:hypothetical protein